MVPYCLIRSCLVSYFPYGPMWSRLVPYGPVWSHMVLVWSCIVRFVPYGLVRSIWASMVPYCLVWSCMVPYCPVWSHMIPFGPIWSCMVPYGPGMVVNCSFCPLWSCEVPYGPVGSCMVQYGPLWSLLILFDVHGPVCSFLALHSRILPFRTIFVLFSYICLYLFNSRNFSTNFVLVIVDMFYGLLICWSNIRSFDQTINLLV